MISTDEAVTIFSCLHDGSIEAWKGDHTRLRLQVSCEYLAKLIDPGFSTFVVQLEGIDRLELDCWTKDGCPRILTDLPEVLRGQLEITAANGCPEGVLITCYQRDPELDYGGGNLLLQCRSVRVFNEADSEYSANAISQLSDRYWDDFAKQQAGREP